MQMPKKFFGGRGNSPALPGNAADGGCASNFYTVGWVEARNPTPKYLLGLAPAKNQVRCAILKTNRARTQGQEFLQ